MSIFDKVRKDKEKKAQEQTALNNSVPTSINPITKMILNQALANPKDFLNKGIEVITRAQEPILEATHSILLYYRSIKEEMLSFVPNETAIDSKVKLDIDIYNKYVSAFEDTEIAKEVYLTRLRNGDFI